MLCYAVLACLLALYSEWLKKKKKDFFSFSEKNCGWYNFSPFVVNVVKKLSQIGLLSCVCVYTYVFVCAHGCPFARGQLRSQRGLG